MRDPRLVLGISSGTSADGVDLALIRVRGRGGARTVEFLAGERADYPAALRQRVRACTRAGLAEVAALHGALGWHFGAMARTFCARLGLAPGELEIAGSHGQTVFHHDGDPAGGSLQLGDGAAAAAALGTAVVADFRWSDLAAGGQGAPISPFADWTLHRRQAARLAILNLGGIANFTLLGGAAPPLAWDSGPANGPLDALAQVELGVECDRDGALARRGRPLPELLAALRADPFFARPLPRSTGLERFGRPLLQQARARAPEASAADLLATFVELAAAAAADSLEVAGGAGAPVYLCGGGAHNPALVEALRRRLAGPLRSYRELGWDPDLREAVAFALLADAWLCGEPATWPTTTGVAAPARLGKLCLPPLLPPGLGGDRADS